MFCNVDDNFDISMTVSVWSLEFVCQILFLNMSGYA